MSLAIKLAIVPLLLEFAIMLLLLFCADKYSIFEAITKSVALSGVSLPVMFFTMSGKDQNNESENKVKRALLLSGAVTNIILFIALEFFILLFTPSYYLTPGIFVKMKLAQKFAFVHILIQIGAGIGIGALFAFFGYLLSMFQGLFCLVIIFELIIGIAVSYLLELRLASFVFAFSFGIFLIFFNTFDEMHIIFSLSRILGLIGSFGAGIGFGTIVNPKIIDGTFFVVKISLIFLSSIIRAGTTYLLSLKENLSLRTKIWCACVNSIKGTVILYYFSYITMIDKKLITNPIHDYLFAIACSYLILGLPLIQLFIRGNGKQDKNEKIYKSRENHVAVIEDIKDFDPEADNEKIVQLNTNPIVIPDDAAPSENIRRMIMDKPEEGEKEYPQLSEASERNDN